MVQQYQSPPWWLDELVQENMLDVLEKERTLEIAGWQVKDQQLQLAGDGSDSEVGAAKVTLNANREQTSPADSSQRPPEQYQKDEL